MRNDPFKRLAWWWNGSWGTLTRRDVWLEHDSDRDLFQLRWKVGSYDEEQRFYLDGAKVVQDLRGLLGEKKTGWLEKVYLDASGTLWDYEHPTDADKAIPNYHGWIGPL